MRSYEYNEDAARQANSSNFIDETGKYVGKFTRVEAVTSKKGTEGLEFTFESDDGRTANYLQLWTHNASGEAIYGFKMLSAVLSCMRVKTIAPEKAIIQDKDSKREATVYPGMTNKPIGVLLQKEFYEKTNGDIGFKFNIFAPFHSGTELTALEMADGKTTPEALAKMVSTLADKPLQKNGRSAPGNSYSPQSENPADGW